ncbi:hypothetical protein LOK49_LG07G02002 [Camellia lanceoleosa]|uniref:Uncharacterized protein n=1 Tax=Camellia lanceoleosa TaxID=1840588 RepID=A0ACC0H5P6_9ERIC|nr:hypothetical protein LOK49_LG07G02002 [Camellia lanceoleosa]
MFDNRHVDGRDLRANDCPSLRTIWSSSKCNKFAILSFKNCFKLIENKQNNIRIENFLLNQFQRNSCGRNCFSIVLPGREIPKWFSHQSRGCWISFQLPPHWFNNSFLGFAFAAVGISNKYKPLLIAMRFKRLGTQRIITKCSKRQITSLPAVDFGNLPVRYVSRSEFLRNVEDDMEQLNEDGIEFQACLFGVCRNSSSGEYQLSLKAAERYCFGENGWEGKNFVEEYKLLVVLLHQREDETTLMTMTTTQQQDPVEVLELMIKRTSLTSTAKGLGCENCANVAPDVFGIEEDFGRARAYSQCGKPELVQQAIDSCPVDCIHWTSATRLSLLEDEMRRVERVNVRHTLKVSLLRNPRDLISFSKWAQAHPKNPNIWVALMLLGMGSSSVDVFRMATSRWEKRQAKMLAKAKVRMMKQKGSDQTESYWSNLWGKPRDYQNTGGSEGESTKSSCSILKMERALEKGC